MATPYQLTWIAEYHGPNPFASGPIVCARLSGTVAVDKAALRSAFQSVNQHYPFMAADPLPLDWPEAQAPLLVLGTAAARFAKAALNEVRGHIEHHGASLSQDDCRLWVGFHAPAVTRLAVKLGLDIIGFHMGQAKPNAAIKAALQKMFALCQKFHPDFQARILMLGAQARNVPFLPFLHGTRYVQFGWGARSVVFFETSSNEDGALGTQWQRDKVLAKTMMTGLGLPVAPHVIVQAETDLPRAIESIGFPCVVKPPASGRGQGVTAAIKNNADLHAAFAYARHHATAGVLVERHVEGHDYRLTVVRGRLLAAVRREASAVVGDGIRTVRALVAALNADRCENLVRSRYLKPVPLDAVLDAHLQKQGVTLDMVLAQGQRISLRSNANRSTGGVACDVTPVVHPAIRMMAEQLALTSGLAVVGIDYLAPDISAAPQPGLGAFIEINATPGLSVCVAAGCSEAALGAEVLGPVPDRIPVSLAIVAPDQVGRLQARLRSLQLQEGHGWVCGNEVQIGAVHASAFSSPPWEAVRIALRNRSLRRLEIHATPAELVAHGLPVDRLDMVTVMTPDMPPAWRDVVRAHADALVDAIPPSVEARC